MPRLIVLENPAKWDLDTPGVQVVSARDYLTRPRFSERRHATVFNLCRSYAYQSTGYYVSLLAAARGHKPLPSVQTLQDLRQAAILRVVSDELQDLMARHLATIRSRTFELSVYFGRNLAKRHDRLAHALFVHFPAPLLRAEFEKDARGRWRLAGIRVIATSDIPRSHRPFVRERIQSYFHRPRPRPRSARFDMAILVDPDEGDAPSNAGALKRFTRAARELEMDADVLTRDDLGRLGEYDALFIRATTLVDHFTFRFANRAEAEGLVVIDDPRSILRCTNKVYQAEVFERAGIPAPRTVIAHRDNLHKVAELGFPLVLKRPDGSFSQGSARVSDAADLERCLADYLHDSELVVAQEFTPSEFDWRIGVLDGRPLHACRYYMAPGHWQIQRTEGGKRTYGRHETLPVEEAPPGAVDTALRAAAAVGDGLYGVDVKETAGRFLVMEVNDNPNIDQGVEDQVLGMDLYRAVMRTFLERLEARGRR